MLLALQPRCNKTLMLYNSTVSIELTLCKFTALIRLNLNLLLHCRRLEEWTLEEYNAKFYKVNIRYSANYVLLSLRYINWRFLELALDVSTLCRADVMYSKSILWRQHYVNKRSVDSTFSKLTFRGEAPYRRRKKTEEKAKVVASVLGKEVILSLSALAILPRTILKNRMKSSLSFISSWCNSSYYSKSS